MVKNSFDAGIDRRRKVVMLGRNRFIVYGGTGHHSLDARVLRLVNDVTNLGLEFRHLWYHTWPDGEPGFRLDHPNLIKDRHVLIFSCPISYKLETELRALITASKQQYRAKSVTAVLSFLRYRRQDRSKLRNEITRLRWFIRNLKHWGADHLIVCEPHSIENTTKYCKEFGLSLHISDPTRLFVDEIRGTVQTLSGAEHVRVYSPDFGSVGRGILLAKALGTTVIAAPKRRIDMRVSTASDNGFLAKIQKKYGKDTPVSCDLSQVHGLHILVREDEIDSGSTAILTAEHLRVAGAKSVRLIATHPVCSPGWKMKLFPAGRKPPFDGLWLGNTRPRGKDETEYEGSSGGRIVKVDMAPAIAGMLAEVLKSFTN